MSSPEFIIALVLTLIFYIFYLATHWRKVLGVLLALGVSGGLLFMLIPPTQARGALVITGFPNLDGILTIIIFLAAIFLPWFVVEVLYSAIGWENPLEWDKNDGLVLGLIPVSIFIIVKIIFWLFSWLFAR